MRLLTRSDFDGLACAVLLKEVDLIHDIKFVHPKDLQDGIVEVTSDDVLANVPYVSGCGMWFDHHVSERSRLGSIDVPGSVEYLDSACRVIYNYYKDKFDLKRFAQMVEMVDKVDAAKLTIGEITNPSGWILLGFLMDPRTGLGRFRNFTISNYKLMENLIDNCRSMDIEEIMQQSDIQERVNLYTEQNELFCQMIKKYTKIQGNIIITDLRNVDTIYSGNRFMLYTMYPKANISIWVVNGKIGNTSIAVGYSIINRTASVNVGDILLKYGGGGHKQVGTCQVENEEADRVIGELIEAFQH